MTAAEHVPSAFSQEERDRHLLRWFSDSRVADRYGRPLIVFHGTTFTKHVPAQTTPGCAEARAQLEKIAQSHGIKDWTDVSSVMRRWLSMGMARERGVTEALVARVVELRERTRPVELVPSRIEIGFDEFALPSGENELGAHFGTRAQAEARGTPFAFYLRIRNPIRLPDLGTWNYQSVIREVRKRGVEITAAEYDEIFNAPDSAARLRAAFLDRGIDGVVYRNEAEGSGDSWIILRSDQVKLVSNSGRFDPDSASLSDRIATADPVPVTRGRSMRRS